MTLLHNYGTGPLTPSSTIQRRQAMSRYLGDNPEVFQQVMGSRGGVIVFSPKPIKPHAEEPEPQTKGDDMRQNNEVKIDK